METTPRKEVGYLDENPASGNPEICREIKRGYMITNQMFGKGEPLPKMLPGIPLNPAEREAQVRKSDFEKEWGKRGWLDG